MSLNIQPPTAADLVKALINGKTEEVERILDQREPVTGVPVVNINCLRPPRSQVDQTALRVVLYATPFFEISQSKRNAMAISILGIVDAQGNPIIELNGTDAEGDTILDLVAKAAQVEKLSKSDPRNLITRIFNLRMNDGSRALRLGVEELTRIRDSAVKEGNSFLVDQINDLRNADGTYVLDRLIPVPAFPPIPMPNFRPTPTLDFRPIPPPNFNILDGIRPYQQRQGNERFPPRPEPRDLSTGPIELQIFANHRQNVHSPEVEQSVLKSITSLCSKYFSVERFSAGWSFQYKKVFEARFKEIETYVLESKREDKQLVQRGLEFILTTPVSHGATFLPLDHIVSLLWIAATDSNAPCPSNLYLDTANLLKLRKEAILDRFVDAEMAYAHGRSCDGGYVNNLVAALSQAHECVNVIQTKSGILSAATDSLNFWILQTIKQLPFEQQKGILSSWDDIESGLENAAYRFHSNPSYIREMFNKLETNYDLSEKLKREIRQAWYSLRRPVLHKELDRLLNQIHGVYHSNQRTFLSQFDQAFQSFTKKVIGRCDSFQQAYDHLSQEYKSYLEIKLSQAFLNDFLEYLPESLSMKTLKSTIKILESGRGVSSIKEQILTEIDSVKGELKKIFLDQIRTSPLKNALMLFVPIVGWAFLLYRYFAAGTVLYPFPSPRKIVLLWSV